MKTRLQSASAARLVLVTEFGIANCHLATSKTLFLMIFCLNSSFVESVHDCRLYDVFLFVLGYCTEDSSGEESVTRQGWFFIGGLSENPTAVYNDLAGHDQQSLVPRYINCMLPRKM